MIIVKNLSFSYGKAQVLRNVSFTAERGELLAVLGPNGVGKSTLFRCILGLAKPQSGEIFLDGERVSSIRPNDLAHKLAYVPQSHAPTFNYSVFDMALMGTTAQVGGLSSPGAAQIKLVNEALERVGILALKNRGYLEISGGERQLTLIARALAQKADTLVLDEPTSNLDYGNQLKVLAQAKELANSGYTVIQSTHNPDQAALFADRVLALKGGTVRALGSSEILTDELIGELYDIDLSALKLYRR
ncbi:MAG: ABC transporter ATP-binding protein [Oscillospiraceae bacterium]|jgi:iron complex transport system ATP-binding protein|nr:ABC transporter ATP-binding protein [Oscillospiraceae bacterium]